MGPVYAWQNGWEKPPVSQHSQRERRATNVKSKCKTVTFKIAKTLKVMLRETLMSYDRISIMILTIILISKGKWGKVKIFLHLYCLLPMGDNSPMITCQPLEYLCFLSPVGTAGSVSVTSYLAWPHAFTLHYISR